MLESILEAIWRLKRDFNCQDSDIVIAYSFLVERFLTQEVAHLNTDPAFHTFDTIHNCKVNNKWPHNEIVIYIPNITPLNEKAIIKLYPVCSQPVYIQPVSINRDIETK